MTAETSRIRNTNSQPSGATAKAGFRASMVPGQMSMPGCVEAPAGGGRPKRAMSAGLQRRKPNQLKNKEVLSWIGAANQGLKPGSVMTDAVAAGWGLGMSMQNAS